MPRRRAYRAVTRIDPKTLADFQAGIRKRYSDEQILDELRACAGRLGKSPTMREFAADSETTVHPQTVIEHFGSWNNAKRRADPSLLTEWQVYRMFDARRGAWSTFQFLIRERLLEEGAEVSSDGRLSSARPRRSG